jgi:hypothetical protein
MQVVYRKSKNNMQFVVADIYHQNIWGDVIQHNLKTSVGCEQKIIHSNDEILMRSFEGTRFVSGIHT